MLAKAQVRVRRASAVIHEPLAIKLREGAFLQEQRRRAVDAIGAALNETYCRVDVASAGADQ